MGNLIESVFKSRLEFVKLLCLEDRWKGGLRRQVGESEMTFKLGFFNGAFDNAVTSPYAKPMTCAVAHGWTALHDPLLLFHVSAS